MKKRIFSRVLALVMAVSLLSTTAFAASFVELQGAIDSGNSVYQEGQNADSSTTGAEKYKIEVNTDTNGTRNVTLWDNVEYAGSGDSSLRANLYVGAPGADQDKKSVVLDLNGYAVDGGNNNSDEAKQSNKPNVIVWEGSTLTVKDTSKTQTGKITGGTGAISVYNGSTLNLESGSITENTGAAVSGGVGSTFNMSGGKITENHGTGEQCGAGIKTSRATVNITGGEISNNTADVCGAGICSVGSTVTISNAIITGNTATGESAIKSGGGIFLSEGSTLTLNGGNRITGNTANRGGGIFVGYGASLTVNGDNEIRNNTAADAGDDIYVRDKAAALNLDNGSWRLDNSGNRNENVLYTAPVDGEKANVGLKFGTVVSESGTEPTTPDTNTTPDDTILAPNGVDTLATTTIEDEEVPLAGIVTLADLLNALWEYEGIEEGELSEDFKWLDHDYAQAICWGLDEALVVDTEDDPLDPDELLTVGLMREVLVNFVELYHGLEDFEVILEGADEDLVMDLGERLTVFYGELEAALEAQAA